jgi:hypothetical protein
LDVTLGNFDVGSSYNASTYERTDGYGQITIDVESTEDDDLNIYGRLDSGPNHGIALNSWSETGEVRINDTYISNMGLDGIWMGSPLTMELEEIDISLNTGWGFYGFEGADITISGIETVPSRFVRNEMGGLNVLDDSNIELQNISIYQNEGKAAHIGEDVTALFKMVTADNNENGIEVEQGCTILFVSSVVDNTNTGIGMDVSDSHVTITGTQTVRSSFSNNDGDGLFMDGGTIEMDYLNANSNGGDGVSLWSVDLESAEYITTSFNQEAGFTAYVDDVSLLDINNQYVSLSNMKTEGNWGPGLTFSIDPTAITSPMEIMLSNFNSYGNRQGDISASKDVHFTWNFMGTGNKLGDVPYYGYTIANIDFISEDGSLGSIINENLTFLNDDASFMVHEGGNL